MMRKTPAFLGLSLLAFTANGCMETTYGEAPSDASIPKKLVILHTTDTHSKFLPFWLEPNTFDKADGLISNNPSCWDINQSGYCDGAYIAGKGYKVWDGSKYVHYTLAEMISSGNTIEDLNHDGQCDVRDCQRCWDTNHNNFCDAEEDVDGILGCSDNDCQVRIGEVEVAQCWDDNKNGQCDKTEDTNNDHICNFQDCSRVWDKNHNLICDNPWSPQYGTYLDDEGNPILLENFESENDYNIAYGAAKSKSEDLNRDGYCTSIDYRPGLIDAGGVARAMTKQKEIQAKHEGTAFLRLDSGDIFQGAPQFNLFKGWLEVTAHSKMGVEAMTMGNHEFDNGAKGLVKAFTKASNGLPILASNYIFDEEDNKGVRDLVHPYMIFQKGQLRIGVIGLGNDTTLTSIYNVSGSLGFNAYDPVYIAQRYVNQLRASCDVIILLTHQGLDQDYILADKVSGVDLILGGHHHVVLNPVKVMQGPPDVDGVSRDVLIVHSGVNYKVLGELELIVKDHKIAWHKYVTHNITSDIPEDATMLNILEPFQEALNDAQDLSKVVGTASATIARNDPNGGDSPLGNLVTDAILRHNMTRAQFAVTNHMGIRADIPTGDITLEKLYEVFPFENTIATMYVSGKEIKEMFDFIARRSASRGCSTQVQVSGMNVTIDCSPSQDLVDKYNSYALTKDLSIGSSVIIKDYELVQPNMLFKMATNDYMAAGGSGFDMLERNTTSLDTSVSLRDALVEFMQMKNVIDPREYTTGGDGNPKRIQMQN